MVRRVILQVFAGRSAGFDGVFVSLLDACCARLYRFALGLDSLEFLAGFDDFPADIVDQFLGDSDIGLPLAYFDRMVTVVEAVDLVA